MRLARCLLSALFQCFGLTFGLGGMGGGEGGGVQLCVLWLWAVVVVVAVVCHSIIFSR
jgi:hypothetical protein